jgi:hypothetical protein
MAALPLYLMAIPLRRSLAAGMDERDWLKQLHGYNVEALALQRGERGVYTRFGNLQL